jgi:hypothetical protein
MDTTELNTAEDKKPRTKEPKAQVREPLPTKTFGSLLDLFAFSGTKTVVKTGMFKYKVLVDPDTKTWQACEVDPLVAKKKKKR